MDCYTFNEETYKKVENFLEKQTAVEHVPEQTYYKSYYSPATLINDWAEKRVGEQPPETSTWPPLTDYMDTYRKLCVAEMPDRQFTFNRLYESYGYGQELLLDHLGTSYYGNYVTTYDLFYNHLKKGLCGPYPRRHYKGHYKPSTDLSMIYGNLTQWGLKEIVYEKSKTIPSCKETVPMSETTSVFVNYNASEIKKLNNFKSFRKIKVVYG